MANEDPFGLEVGYGFQTPPDEEMIRALMGQMQLGNKAKLAQPRLEKQMTQAEALRDRPAPRSTSWLSGLSQLGNTAAGLRDVRDTKRQQIEGEQALGNSMAAQQQAEMQRQSRTETNALAGLGLQQGNRDEDNEGTKQAALLKASALAQHQAAERRNRLDVKRLGQTAEKSAAPGYFFDEVTGERFRGGFDPNANGGQGGHVIRGGERDGEVYDPMRVKQFGDSSLNTDKTRDRILKAPQHLEMSYRYLDKTASEWEDLSKALRDGEGIGMPTSVLQDWFLGGEKQGIYDYIDQKSKGKYAFDAGQRKRARKSIAAFNEIRTHVVMPYREENTSGALSDRDVAEFARNVLMQPGAGGGLLYDSAQSLFGNREKFIREQIGIYDDNGDQDSWRRIQNSKKALRPVGWEDERKGTPEQRGTLGWSESGQVPVGGASAGLDPVPPEQAGQAGRPAPLPPFDPQQYQDALYMAKTGNADAIRYVETYAEQAGK